MLPELNKPESEDSGPRISVCVITRNEEFNIEFCLKSIIPIASEIIVLDTGSTDKTKEIVSGLNSPNIRLYELPWENDFSKARNHCISFATGEWIFCIDSDEFLTEHSQKNIVNMLKKRETESPKPDIYNFHIIPPESADIQPFYRVTLFRAGLGLKFVRPLHEHLDVTGRDLTIVNCPLFTIQQIDKLQSKTEYRKKEEYYIEQLKKIIAGNPDKSDNYFYYKHLGDSYSNLGRFEDSLEAYYQSYQIYQQYSLEKKDRVFYKTLLVNIIRKLLFYFGRNDEALILIDELLNISESTDGYSFLAYCKQAKGRYSEALAIYRYTLQLLVKKDPYNLNKPFYNYINDQIEKCLEQINKKVKGAP
jgi:glycosyltransferase involved in cell wall biosynthesis